MRLNAIMMPHHRAEQADERRDARGGRQERQRVPSLFTSVVAARSSARSTASRLLSIGRAGGAPLDWPGSGRCSRNCAFISA